MAPSYAAVALADINVSDNRATATSPAQSAIKRLSQPPPSSFTLVAALQLLEPVEAGQTVYLLPPSYVQNWLTWAFHQLVPEDEEGRVKEALRLAAVQFGLVPPMEKANYTDPSSIDIATALAVEGHPLVLDPTVRLKQKLNGSLKTGPMRQLSFDNLTIRDGPTSNGDSKHESRVRECLAVPEAFYETLRSVHGVVCDDGFTVSFQPGEIEALLLHHEVHQPEMNGSLMNRHNRLDETPFPRPVEFRRKVIWKNKQFDSTSLTATGESSYSLMEQLMQEEALLNAPSRFPTPEIHPYQFLYRITKSGHTLSQNVSPQGWALISSGAVAFDALSALLRAALPTSASHSVRLWTKRDYSYEGKSNPPISPSSSTVGSRLGKDNIDDYPTLEGDGYEWVDLEALSKRPPNADSELTTIQEWVQTHFRDTEQRQVECLLEMRPAVHAPWPRQSFLLAERLKPGDFCDAQDIAGQWYEALVVGRETIQDDDQTFEKVKVHYMGWASRWNASVPLIKGKSKLSLPAPLWSRSTRWRENIKEGDEVEVRDSSSIVERPKWYRGIIKKVGAPGDSVRDMTGGADLEIFPPSPLNSSEGPLRVLGRQQQVLVEVKQERTEKAGPATTSLNKFGADPPFLRWVSLYGEEICKMGTHLKVTKPDDSRKPVTITYEYDGDRKPVEIMKGHPSLGAGFVRESIRGPPPAPGSVGLHNLGNSCYLNSTVQCLSQVEPVTQYFMRERYDGELNRNNPLGSGGHVATAYASLLRKIWGGDHSVLAPRLLKQTVGAFAPQFNNCYQHDSQEFCQFLMDGLHEDLNRVKTKPYVEDLEGFGMPDDKAAIESWRKHLLRHDSVVVDHCQGMHRSHLTCPRCGRESIKFDVYSSISLPLASKKDHSVIQLKDCLERFMEGEQLDERNAWYCPRCRQHVCALKMIALWTTPDILILHLKRFTFEPNLLSGGMLRSKVDDTVAFPVENLDLTKYILGPIDPDAPPIYNLIGVSEHIGPTANSGHYTATVRNSIDGQWYRFNDSNVGRTSGEAAMTGGAYMLFYQRAKGYAKWGGMEYAMKERGVNPYGGMEVDQDGFKKVKAKKKKK
eukprot:scaffold316_cov158-Amphora_coffeaeformis.AAC.5